MRSLLIAVTVALTSAASLAAADAGTPRFVDQVSHADLDLSTERDAKILLGRLGHAADRLCQDAALARVHGGFAACKTALVAHAVVDLDNIVVSAMYAGEPPAVLVADARRY